MMKPTACLLFTMGDVAGIGPEVLVKAWPELTVLCRPVVVGDVGWLRRALALVGSGAEVVEVKSPDELTPHAQCMPCLQATAQDLEGVVPGEVSAAAGRGVRFSVQRHRLDDE